jgi:hypothetical protein
MKFAKPIYILIFSALFIFSSCRSFSRSSESTAEKSTAHVLEEIFNSVMGETPLTDKNMEGTWNFNKSAVAFETANLLKKAGGAIVASQVQAKLDESTKSLGINSTNTTFTFHADSTYSAKIRGVKISGKYSLDPQTKTVRMSYLMGVAHLDAVAVVSTRDMKLLFDADSFLKLMKFISQFTHITSIEVLGKMADMYDGMLMGFDLKKQ